MTPFKWLTLQVPPLENGDRLTRAAFEQRYEAMPRVKKAELINQTVYMASPVRASLHGQPHTFVMTWLGTYIAATPYVMAYDNATVRLDPDNEIQHAPQRKAPPPESRKNVTRLWRLLAALFPILIR